MYVGIDAHKRECHATVLNEQGEKLSAARFPTNLGALTAWAKTLPPGSCIAIEASTVAKRLYWHLKEMGLDVRMAHPLEVRRMAGRKKKTDALDSFELADLLRMRRLPEAYVPSRDQNERRQLLRYRIDLGRQTNVVKCQIHALVLHNGISSKATDLFGVKGRAELAAAKLPPTQQVLAQSTARPAESHRGTDRGGTGRARSHRVRGQGGPAADADSRESTIIRLRSSSRRSEKSVASLPRSNSRPTPDWSLESCKAVRSAVRDTFTNRGLRPYGG